MRIALSQVNLRVGDLELNAFKIKEQIRRAARQGADLVVFSELSVCGYPPADLLNFDGFVRDCLKAVGEIAGHCQTIAAVVGAPAFNEGRVGKRLYNAAFFLANGRIEQVVYKALLPTYDVFDEYRYFEPASKFSTISLNGRKLALTICEDIWNIGNPRLYPADPMEELIKQSPDFMINISASPFAWNRGPERMNVLRENARKYRLPLFYVNQMGAQTDLIFDGASSVIRADGQLHFQMASFKEDLRVFDTEQLPVSQDQTWINIVDEETKNALLFDGLVLGIRDYFQKMGLGKAIVGLSGGIDSALTLVLASEALGSDKLWAVLLPGPYSSEHSVKDAKQLAEKLGVVTNTVSIESIDQSLHITLSGFFKDTPSGVAEENLQARARAIVLMALSNKFGHVLLNTSNKSEAAVGYGTLYGDMCGGLSVIGDLYKTEVYSLARYINRNEEIIPEHTISKPPSAELKPDQKDTDSLPPYEILDQVLFHYIEMEMTSGQIKKTGLDSRLVDDIIGMVNQSEYKRKQSPPALRVSQKSLGSGRRMPIVAQYRL